MKSLLLVTAALFLSACSARSADLLLSCSPDNDLYQALAASDIACTRYDTGRQAVAAASPGSGVLILADGYPEKATAIPEELLKEAAAKKLRLFVEYPAALPGLELGKPRKAHAERAVVRTDFFGPSLPRMRILAVNGMHFIPLEAGDAHIVAARVAGFDRAVYGLPGETFPLLFEFREGDILVAACKLSHFVTARYAPRDAWQALWQGVLRWLLRGEVVNLRWTPAVRPAFGRDEKLPADVERQALKRGIDWFIRSKLLVHPSQVGQLGKRVPTPPPDAPVGDGSLGIMEAPISIIRSDGSQMLSSARRGDCNAESAMALAFGGKVLDDEEKSAIARNILDFYLLESDAQKRERGDPEHGAYGLLAWGIDSPAWYKANYGDDNARVLLGSMAVAALLHEDRWNECMMKCLLANLRTTGASGFRGNRIDVENLAQGWQPYFERDIINCRPHYEAYLWACYLWAYRQTGSDLFYTKTENALRITMENHTDGWRWTNGLAQERARILLPLAWLVRAKDTPEHRRWLIEAFEGLLALQEPCGAIREELGLPGKGDYAPPATNEAYGKSEASLIQENGDPVTDLLYTTNFALLGLHEAAAAIDDPRIREAEDRLVAFLCRIQIASEAHPALHGGWFRAFDYERWEAWASNADHGWGAWAIESGWTQGWITSVLAMRQMKTSLWDLTRGVAVGEWFEEYRGEMLGGVDAEDNGSGNGK